MTPRALTPLGCALALTLATVAQAAPQTAPTEPAMTPAQDTTARTSVEGEGVRLEVAFDREDLPGQLSVRYRVSNTGTAPLAVFDRGDRQAVVAGQLALGSVPAPAFSSDGGDVELRHAGQPLPDPSPTLPPVPLAARVVPGDIVEGAFTFDPALTGDARRVRWCVGVAPFADTAFDGRETVGLVDTWRAMPEAIAAQVTLCTPWYGLDGAVFEEA